MSGLLAVSYMNLNKKVEEKASLISDEIANELMLRQERFGQGNEYSNVYNAKMNTVIKTNTSVSTSDCKALCDGTPGCQGFQMYPNNTTCDLLSNLNTTYSFTEPGWNFYMLKSKLHMKGFDSPIQDQEISGSKIGSTISTVNTRELCAPLCLSNNCSAFTINSYGCSLHQNDTVKVPSTGSITYKLKKLKY